MQLLRRRRFALFQQEAACSDHSQELLSEFPVLSDGQDDRGAEVWGDGQDEAVCRDAQDDFRYCPGVWA